jgi:cytochrome c551/c552
VCLWVVTGAVAEVAAQQPQQPSPAHLTPAELKPGLVAEYQGSGAGSRPRWVCLESSVAVLLDAGQTVHPQLGPLTQAQWRGYVNVVRGGTHRFSAIIRRGRLQVWVDGQEVLQAEAGANEQVVEGPAVTLAGGVRRFEVRWHCTGTPTRCSLWWEGPGFIREPLNGHYLGHIPSQRPAEFVTQVQQEHGRFLFEELACVRCHRPTGAAATDANGQGVNHFVRSLVDHAGPPLTGVGRRLYAHWLYAWLADPPRWRPQTTMPRLFADDATGRAERYAIVQFFVQQAGEALTQFRPPLLANNEWKQSVARGRVLFYVTGCAACHLEAQAPKTGEEDEVRPALRPEEWLYGLGTPAGPAPKYLLGALGSKTRPEVLANYLQDPLAFHPGGRMPRMQLSAQEATDLARYLCQSVEESIPTELPVPSLPAQELFARHQVALPAGFEQWSQPQRWAAAGQMLLVAKGCVNCHELEVGGERLVGRTAAPLERVLGAPPRGCLGEDAQATVRYGLTATQRQALQVFVRSGGTASGWAAPAYAARVALRRYGCLNCHVRDGEGGLSQELAERMRLLEKAENADDVRPPVLTGIGHKSRHSWLRAVLLQGQRARPWMQLRMPQYGPQAVGSLPEALCQLDGLPADDTLHRVPLSAEKITAGRQLVGKQGLGCISCHDISGIANPGTRGPDLATMQQRVRYEWYQRWLHQPLRLAPGTRMPAAFVDGQSTAKGILAGQAAAQAEAMWAYLSLGPGLPLPDGLEPPKGLILAVGQHPQLLRTFLPEAGARAIAVGYPQGIHCAYDAQSCRFVYAWSGNFLDVSPVWHNRGGAPAKLLGSKVWTAPAVPPWGWRQAGSAPPDFVRRLQDPAWGAPLPQDPPRVYGGPRCVEFVGYQLDEQQRPIFRCRVAAEDGAAQWLHVSEMLLPLRSAVATGLIRQMHWETPTPGQVWFLVGESGSAPRLLDKGSGQVRPWTVAENPEVHPEGVRVLLTASGGAVLVVEASAAPAGSRWQWVAQGQRGALLLRFPRSTEPQRGQATITLWSVPREEPALIQNLDR